MTNGDKIRQMTDEELAVALSAYSIFSICDIVCRGECRALQTLDETSEQVCIKIIKSWLKQEAESDS